MGYHYLSNRVRHLFCLAWLQSDTAAALFRLRDPGQSLGIMGNFDWAHTETNEVRLNQQKRKGEREKGIQLTERLCCVCMHACMSAGVLLQA